MSSRRPRRLRGASDRLYRRRHQIDRAGRHQPQGRRRSSRARGRMRNSTSAPIRNSCARARRSRISAGPTASSSAATATRAREVMREIYRPLYLHETPILFTSPRKLRAHQIRGERVPRHQDHLHQRDGRSLREGRRATCRTWRAASVSTAASAPSSCMRDRASAARAFPKDTLALLKTSQDGGAPTRIVEAVVAVNEARKVRMAEKIEHAFGGVQRQDRRGARPDLQAQHRRHARRAEPRDRAAPA